MTHISPYMNPIDLIYGFTLVSHYERSGSYMLHIGQKKVTTMYSKEIYTYYVRGFFHTYLDYLFYK
jgi:hypothetical protein